MSRPAGVDGATIDDDDDDGSYCQAGAGTSFPLETSIEVPPPEKAASLGAL